MKILFLDDDVQRHIRFKMGNIGRDVTYVWNAEEAIEALKKDYYDEASLDHDLGGVASQLTLPDAGKGSGYDVAMFIAELPVEKRPEVVILHSFNPEGVTRMCMALKQAAEEGTRLFRIPFNW